ncbi:Xaa-Pro peptidase family protein [Candidatus Bathyarchaeota archaeon]|nr:Xaa-Pro peptidase family protein [Candidatus Bathyarchaeota archaeon]
MNRVEALKQSVLDGKRIDGLLVFNAANQIYLTGVSGETARATLACVMISKKGENIIYVYNVNYEQAKAEGKGFRVELVKRREDLVAQISAKAKSLNMKNLVADFLSVETHRLLMKGLHGQARLEMQSNLLWEMRKVKSEKELEFMRKAGDLTSIGMKAAYETIRPGVKEIEVAAEIEYAMRKRGGWGTAFETSVASAARSAFPHGGCTARKIAKGDLVVVDIGAIYDHYCSDMTRTVVAGKPSDKQKKLHGIVKKAQFEAFKTMKPKVEAKKVDAAARNVVAEAGYGEYFVHGLGHGVGLEVHEPPTLNSESKDILAVGNVVTNEPGIYLIGFGGIRIEDSVLIQERGGENLTNGSYDLETAR